MTTNLKFLLLFLFASITVIGNTLLPSNKYQRVVKEYNITPNTLTYGYPLWYKLEEKSITGVIYLSNEVEYLEKINAITYVCQPTVENATEIGAFAKEITELGLFYVVVDTAVNQGDLTKFLQEVSSFQLNMEIRLADAWGRWVSFDLNNWNHERNQNMWMGCGYRNRLDVLINGRNDLLIEGKFIDVEQVDHEVFNHFFANYYKQDADLNAVNYNMLTTEICHAEINNWENFSKENLKDEFIEREMDKWRTYLKYCVSFPSGSMILANRSSFIQIKTQRNTSLAVLYTTLNEINKGIYKARNEISLTNYRKPYAELFLKREIFELGYLELTIPEKIVFNELIRREEPISYPMP